MSEYYFNTPDKQIIEEIKVRRWGWISFYVERMEISVAHDPDSSWGKYVVTDVFPDDTGWEEYVKYIEQHIIEEVNAYLFANREQYWRPHAYHTDPVSHFNVELHPRTLYFGLELEHEVRFLGPLELPRLSA